MVAKFLSATLIAVGLVAAAAGTAAADIQKWPPDQQQACTDDWIAHQGGGVVGCVQQPWNNGWWTWQF